MGQPFFGRFGEEFGLSRMHPTCIIIRQGLGYFHHSEHTEVLFRFGTARPYRFGCQLIPSGKSAVLEQRPDLHLLWLQDWHDDKVDTNGRHDGFAFEACGLPPDETYLAVGFIH